ncbi:hypothetical protein [Microbulbifer epialgicus]|uniref:Uncharacterized protein n=1 Tax=Microbulbifer epialgicus TaxID=393907 RepID=A0ABV4NX97_9GAMM
MLPANIDTYIRNIAQTDQLQTRCQPSQLFREYATDFQRNSQSGWHSRSGDGLDRIDDIVRSAAQIQTLDYVRIAYVSRLLVMALYQWLIGNNSSNPNQRLSVKSINRRRDAIIALTGGAYCWYRQSYEAASSEQIGLNNIQTQTDISFNLYRYRFSRPGYNLHMSPGRLYRGDTRSPAVLWRSGGFFPKMANPICYDPHFNDGASQQVISSTDDLNLVTRFAWHNPAYCPRRFYCLHGTSNADKPIAGFIYEFDKSGHECLEVANVPAGREAAYLAIPNQFIRRFRMRYYAGSQNNIVLSDWMYYNDRSIQNIRIFADRQTWQQAQRHWHATH